MSTPNVAVAFPQTARDAIITKFSEGMALFPVLATVSLEDRKKLPSIAEGREPFVADAYSDAKANPQTVPGTVDVTEWGRLEEQHAGLVQLESLLQVMLEQVRDTKALSGAARYRHTRRYYDYLGGNLDVLPGAEAIHARIGRLYAGQGNRATPPPTPPAPHP